MSISSKALCVAALVALGAAELKIRAEQDPCAGCTEDGAYAYQVCAKDHGNPCAETVDGLVTDGPGKKKDIGCCMKKEKHERCLKCTTMDCQFNTCKVNKNYYSEYSKIHKEATKDKNWDKKAMKAAGWGM